MTRRSFLYPLPNDGFKVMLDVVNALPDDDENSLFSWERVRAVIAKISDDKAAVYLRMNFPHQPPTISGAPVLGTDEVWIEDEDRPEAERILAENCGSPPVVWQDLMLVSFTNDEEHRAFGNAYSRITGLPNFYAEDDAAPLEAV